MTILHYIPGQRKGKLRANYTKQRMEVGISKVLRVDNWPTRKCTTLTT